MYILGMDYTQIYDMVKAVGAPTATLVVGLYFISRTQKTSERTISQLTGSIKKRLDDRLNDEQIQGELLNRMERKVNLILDQASNELDEDNVVNMGVNYLQKVHLMWISYYQLRKEQNHILEQTGVVSARWEEKIKEFRKKITGQFGRYTHKGVVLDNFWGEDGAEIYCNFILNDLFTLQYNQAANIDCLIKDTELETHFEIIISAMIGMFRVWAKAGKNFKSQWEGSLPKTTMNQIDFIKKEAINENN